MASSSQKGKLDSQLRLVLGEDALAYPDAEPTDDTPTIISKNAPEAPPAPADLASSLNGRQLAHFELIAPIGVGGMAAVIRARDTQLDRFVALKILPPEMAADSENVRRFHQEARAAAKLDHENIARVFFCGEEQNLHFIAFEFVEGDNLRTVLERRGQLPVPEAIRIILQVATGLEHAASRGVVHRDVKPSNIILSSSGRAKLVDMGLARSLERKGEQDLTQSGMTLGTFDYISPEQALEPRDADSRSDIYSLGCTLYHMLTGHAPVPEGTAAKKLHHHQHVAPLDPRQLNPAVPDEVAVVLSRMMAKNPRDRYQRPIQLVQHLMQIAHKVGAADDLQEGVLFVDAPLLAPPRHRPLLLIGIAAGALALVMLALSLAPPERLPVAPVKTGTPTASVVPDPRANPPEAVTPPPKVSPVASPAPISPLAKLQADLSSTDPMLTHRVVGKLDISDARLVVPASAARNVTLESDDTEYQSTLRFVYAAGEALAGLTIEGGQVTLRNLRIEIEAGITPRKAVAAVLVRGGTVRFERCTFVQSEVPQTSLSRTPLASVLVETNDPGATAPRVFLDSCTFQSSHTKGKSRQEVPGGQAAVAVNGPARVQASNCAFLPHSDFFHLRAGCKLDTTSLTVNDCTAFVVNGPAFRFDELAAARLDVRHSIFSRPEATQLVDHSEPDLIRQADSAPLRYEGEHNLYHALNSLWVRKVVKAGTLDEFRKELIQNERGRDDDSLFQLDPESGPWQAKKPLDEREMLAFQVKHRFQSYGLASGTYPWGTLAAAPEEKAPPLPANVKIVDPEADGKTAGVFATLGQAFASARTGDVLLLRHAPERPEFRVAGRIELDAGLTVTLRPAEGCQPLLVFDRKLKEKDAAFFSILDGALRLENLRFLLEPTHDAFTAQSVVQLGENGQCAMQGCVVTLKPGKNVPLGVVTLVDPIDKIKMEPPTQAPVKFDMADCVVRGEGDLIPLRGNRRLDVTLDQSLIALAGSLLTVRAADKDLATEAGVKLTLTRVAALTTEPLLVLRGKTGKGLTRTRIDKAEGCLFAALAGRPLAILETPESMMGDDNLTKYLDWKGSRNFYANFDRFVEQQRPDAGMPTNTTDPARWRETYPEMRSRHEPLSFFPSQPDLVRTLWQATPDQLRPAEAEANFPFGPDPERLPRFAPDPMADPTSNPSPES